MSDWNVENITKTFHDAEAESGKIDMQLLRVLVTGVAGGPQLFDMLALIGKDGAFVANTLEMFRTVLGITR